MGHCLGGSKVCRPACFRPSLLSLRAHSEINAAEQRSSSNRSRVVVEQLLLWIMRTPLPEGEAFILLPPVTANPPLEKFFHWAVHTCFLSCYVLTLEKPSPSRIFSNLKLLTFQILFEQGPQLLWKISNLGEKCIMAPLHAPLSCVKTPCSWWCEGLDVWRGLYVQDTWRHHPAINNPPPVPPLWGRLCQHTPALSCTDVVALSGAPKPRSAQLGAPTH